MIKTGVLYLLILFIFFSALSLYRHKNISLNTFRSEIWADRAGYYIYLPSTFIYKYSTNDLPKNIDKLTGNGFKIKDKKIITKYTYGVSLLQAPFFLIADFITYILSNSRDGFSFFYQKAIDLASVFYLSISLYLLFLSIRNYTNFNNTTIIITLTLLFFGTNLYYYSIIETGMSHIYSFFIFTCLLYLKINNPKFRFKYTYNVTFSILLFLSILIRPINIIFLVIPLTWGISSAKQLYFAIKSNLKINSILIWIFSFALIFVPQFIYWKYSYGSFFIYSYENENFSNLLSPKVIEVVFSPNNGLLPYSLAFIGVLIGIILLLKDKLFDAVKYVIILLLLIYLTASWHDWRFGCGIGMRNMVEYYSALSFPLAMFINYLYSLKNFWIKASLFICICIFSIISFKVNYHYYGCYFGNTWDWTDYLKILQHPLKFN